MNSIPNIYRRLFQACTMSVILFLSLCSCGNKKAESKEAPVAKFSDSTYFVYDMEGPSRLKMNGTEYSYLAHSGEACSKTSKEHAFGATLDMDLDSIISPGDSLTFAYFKCWVNPLQDSIWAQLVMTVEDPSLPEGKQILFWGAKDIFSRVFKPTVWSAMHASYGCPTFHYGKHLRVKFFVWNRGSTDLLADDYIISINDERRPKGLKTIIPGEQRNSLPKIFWLTREEMGNENTDLLYPKGVKPDIRILPEDKILAGHFSNETEGRDELVWFSGNKLIFSRFDINKHQFVKNREVASLLNNTPQAWVKGDFDADGLDEIFWSGSNAGIYFPATNKVVSTPKVLESYTIVNLYASDLDCDGKDDLIIQNIASEGYNAFKWKDNKWIRLLEYRGKRAPIHNATFIQMPDNKGKQKLHLLEYKVDGSAILKLVTYDKATSALKFGPEIIIPAEEKFLAGDAYMNGNFSGNGYAIMKYNRDKRFDLRLIQYASNKLQSLGRLDFSGFPGAANPKFYESLRLVPGNFIDKNKTSVLAIMCNCLDEKYNGKNCTKYGSENGLPASIQLFTITQP